MASPIKSKILQALKRLEKVDLSEPQLDSTKSLETNLFNYEIAVAAIGEEIKRCQEQ